MCGRSNSIDRPDKMTLLREITCVNCHSSLRNQAVAQVIIDNYVPDAKTLRECLPKLNNISIYNPQSYGSIHEILQNLTRYHFSEYNPQNSTEIPNENLEALTFLNNTFDLIILQDILEHVRKPRQALAELNRVLKPDGLLIITIPYHPAIKTRTRTNQFDANLMLPVYHGDPNSPEGSLVYTDFGHDFWQILEGANLSGEKIDFQTWYSAEEITNIDNHNEYQRYLACQNYNNYFQYNNQVFTARKTSDKITSSKTEERFVPTISDPITSMEHWHRYQYILPFVENKKVLDVASGEGYGCNLMAEKASKVVGVDIDQNAIERAKKTYPRTNLEFISGSAAQIPLGQKFDIITSFETIEHIPADLHHIFLQEVKRLLAPDGMLIISTPDKEFYSDLSGYSNKFHLKEYYLAEFRNLLGNYFANIRLINQNIFFTSQIFSSGKNNIHYIEDNCVIEEEKINPTEESKPPKFFLCFCSQVKLPQLNNHQLNDIFPTVQGYYQRQIKSLLPDLKNTISQQKLLINKKQAQIKQLQSDIATFRTSTSWRLTKPLRDFKDKSSHIRQLVKSTLKEQGIGAVIAGGFSYLGKGLKKAFAPAKKPTGAKILFLSQANQASYRYRCLNQAEALRLADIEADAFRIDEFNLADLAKYDIIVFHRVILSETIELFIQQNPDKTYIYDADDLIFLQSHLTKLPGIEQKSAESKNLLQTELINKEKLVRLCHNGFGSTPAIVKEFEAVGLQSHLVPNVLDEATKQMFSVDQSSHPGIKLGFISGSQTHDDNLQLIAPVIARLFDRYETLQLKIIGPMKLPADFSEYRDRIEQIDFVPFDQLPAAMTDIDINLAPLTKAPFNQGKSAIKFLEASLLKIPTVASAVGGFSSTIQSGQTGYLCRSDEEWRATLIELIENNEQAKVIGQQACDYVINQRTTRQSTLPEIIKDIQLTRKNYLLQPPYPKVSIVSILYKKAAELPHFIESIKRQTYQGEIEIVLVNDRSPDNSAAVARDLVKNLPDNISIKIIENESNRGNCYSRNRGLSEAAGEIIIVIDVDCVINPDFIIEHANTHTFGDTDVAIGYMNLETNGEDPAQAIKKYQDSPELLAGESQLQDPINLNSFVNCVTRNFSISAQFLDRHFSRDKFFDEELSLSNKPDSGFGWEDIEMGYRVWQSGGVIKFNPQTFSVHISHESNVPEGDKPLKSLKNFRRLHEKHPELYLEARRWTFDTFEKIIQWADNNQLDYQNNPDYQWLSQHLKCFRPYPFAYQSDRPLKILTYHWHTAHQYEIYKLGHQFDLVTDTGSYIPQKWNYEVRPKPTNTRLVSLRDINIKDYDLAILHFDENSLTPENCAGKISSDWGTTFRWFHEHLKIPKIAICHGTPQFYGQYNLHYNGDNLGEVVPSEREKIVNYLGDTQVICNSHQAFHEWNFNNAQVIWHGFDPTEFPLTDYSRGVLSLSQAMKDRPFYRGYELYQAVVEKLGSGNFDSYQVNPPHEHYSSETNEYALAKFYNYRRNIGQYSIYFNPTLRSPMPRSRGEAMMCGLVTVNADNHDVNKFIKNGINGFYSHDPGELAEYIRYLLDNPEKCQAIGQRARLTAIDIFNHDRFLYEWNQLIAKVIT